MSANQINMSPEALAVQNTMIKRARGMKHIWLGPEHLLDALLSDSQFVEILGKQGVNIEMLSKDIAVFLEENHKDYMFNPLVPIQDFKTTQDLTSIYQTASSIADNDNSVVTSAHLFIAIMKQECDASAMLKFHGAKVEMLNEILENSPNKIPFAQDLVLMSKTTKFEPLVGREKEIDRMAQILLRKTKNNPVLVGEAGVGKTALVEGLAQKIAEKTAPLPLLGKKIYSIDLPGMVAGSRYRGDFEERLKKTVKMIQSDPDAIMFVDEIHQLVGSGGNGKSDTMDAADIIKPMLARGQLRCIGATTWNEWRSKIENDTALSRRFQRIEVGQPSAEESKLMLMGAKSRYEEHHKVKIDDAAIYESVDESILKIHDRSLPDKAFDALDEACSRVRLDGGVTVDTDAVKRAVALIARIPLEKQKEIELDKLFENVSKEVMGQNEAIKVVVDAVLSGKAGLNGAERPMASLMFQGPTGVGKTETAKLIAKEMHLEFLRIDMSEFSEKHAVARLIGAPPGYVGYEGGGQLTDAIFAKPNTLILFDEIEKAHPDVWPILLQIMDYGKLTDARGRAVHFSQCVVIMTTNTGAFEAQKAGIGFGSNLGGDLSEGLNALDKTFPPEFRGRLDGIVSFKGLNSDMIEKIVMKMIKEIEKNISKKNVTIEVSDSALKLIASESSNTKLGARAIRNIVQNRISRPLAPMLLFGSLSDGGICLVDALDGNIVLSKKED